MDWFEHVEHEAGCSLAYLREFVAPDTLCTCVEAVAKGVVSRGWELLTYRGIYYYVFESNLLSGSVRAVAKSQVYRLAYGALLSDDAGKLEPAAKWMTTGWLDDYCSLDAPIRGIDSVVRLTLPGFG